MKSILKSQKGVYVGTNLFCADYSAIEARVLFWLADHADGINAYRDNRPIYEEMAARIYNLKVTAVTKDQRELGKRVILGCGYNMGPDKFMETCQTFGNFPVTESLAKMAVAAYRELHAPVPVYWKAVERAAIAAVSTGKIFKIRNVKFFVQKPFLYIELPSGRRLAYYGPSIRYKETPWGEKRPALYHWSVNPISRQWADGGTYGGRLVENITQAVARDLMSAAMLRIENAGFCIVLSVHDELLAEGLDTDSLKEFESLMSELPPWAAGLPVKVAGWRGKRYRK